MNSMLWGNATHNMDEKGRVSLPSKFRKQLGLESGTELIICFGHEGCCLSIFTYDAFENFITDLEDDDCEETRNAAMIIRNTADSEPLDGSGRLMIVPHLRAYGKLGKGEVVISGSTGYLQLWSKAEWDKIHVVDASQIVPFTCGRKKVRKEAKAE